MSTALAVAPAKKAPTKVAAAENQQTRMLQRKEEQDPLGTATAGACACGGGCPRCAAESNMQTKLAVSQPGDALELEADRIADAVTPALSSTSTILQRACACGGTGEDNCSCENAAPVMRKADDGATESRAPPIDNVISQPGQALPASVRKELEPRFGHDFGNVRLHTDEAAARSAASVHAHAYTVGSNIVFAAGQYAPSTTAGRRLIAHELTHVAQQAGGAARSVQRFVPCTKARLSLEECPSREPGEITESRTDPMEVQYIETPEKGYLIYNFAVGDDMLKPSALTHPNWQPMVDALSDNTTEWHIIGLADCQGADALNTSLRSSRAGMVFAFLPDKAAAQVRSVAAAPLHDCITDNTTGADRTFNRAVLITREKQTITFEPKEVEGTRPVPKPQAQPTVDCNDSQQKELAAAQPIAIAMTQKAMAVLGQRRTPEIRALLSKYFNDPAGNWRINSGFKNILYGLKDNVKLECENKDDTAYSHFCPQSSTRVRVAYVRTLAAFRVHLCEAAFGRGDLELAETLVHEFSHMYDHTNILQDETYCWGGGCSSLDRWDAYDNADSFSAFAAEAYVKGL